MTSSSMSCLLGGEEAERLHERNDEEDDSRYERRDRYGNPNLLGAPLDRRNATSVDLPADRARFFGNEPSQIARVAIQGEYGRDAVELVDACDLGPLVERCYLGESLPHAPSDACQIATRATLAPGGETVERGAEGVAGRQQHPDLLGHDRQLEEERLLPRGRLARELLLDDEEGQQGSADHGQEHDRPRRASRDGRDRRECHRGRRPAELADPELGRFEW